MDRFGLWTVLGAAESRPRTGGYIPQVRARCACGTERIVQLPNLRAGLSKSCGCFRRARSSEVRIRHGDARKGITVPEYSAWQSMRKRCADLENPDYGGRGIRVCRRWMRYENFLADVGRRPSPKHSLEREDNDGDYTPKNCRWATSKEQRANQRKRARIDQFSDAELSTELVRRGYHNPLRVAQHHGAR